MNFWPYRKYSIISDLSLDELTKKFKSKPHFYWAGDPSKRTRIFTNYNDTLKFRCDLYRWGLRASEERIGRYRIGTFRPEAKVLYRNMESRNEYEISMRPNMVAIVFISFCMIFVSIAGIFIISTAVTDGTLDSSSFTFVIFLIVPYLMVTVGFNDDLPQLESFIGHLLETDLPTINAIDYFLISPLLSSVLFYHG